ncbi:calmodulin-binding transcription activator 1 isoform X5 [Hippopotamus amphibius kiboko]|uniref:calmodulin-binding transcription activator 1 isoform X5 n=1 Tax=Hippopotamus amphibius kiboko TaxID=575201 RepID=UPI0025994257|nr:calmodulin-binding transcription activator 1 isoform X5 [Hippopotamus amphibius kiboko]
MWRAEGKWLPKTSRKSVSQSVFCGTSTYCVLNTVPPIEDDHGNSNSSHVKIFLPKKLLECLPKCSSLPKERHRWNTNELTKHPRVSLVLAWQLRILEQHLGYIPGGFSNGL